MAEPTRFSRPLDVEFGGTVITLRPIKGIEALSAFQSAVAAEVQAIRERFDQAARLGDKVSPEVLLDSGVDVVKLLRLGAQDLITDELLEESTLPERLGALTFILHLNNLGRFSPFLSLETLVEISNRLNQRALDSPLPGRSGVFSTPASTGAPSSTS